VAFIVRWRKITGMRTALRPGLAARSNRFAETEGRERSTPEKAGPNLAVLTVVMWAAGLVFGFETSVSMLTAVGFLTIIIVIWSPGIGLLGIGLIATMDAVSRNFLLTVGLLRWNTFNYLLLFVLVLNLPNFLRINDLHTR